MHPISIADNIVIIGDVHLCKNNANKVTYSFTQRYFTEQVIPLIKDMGEDCVVVFMGDIWHNESYISTYIGSKFTENVFNVIVDLAAHTYILVGNHDVVSLHTNSEHGLKYFTGRKKVTVIEDFLTLGIHNFLAHDYNYPRLIDKIEAFSPNTYLYMHGEIDGFVYKGHDSVVELKKSHLEKFIKVFNGHIHNKSVVGNIVNTGSIEQNNYGERKNTTGIFVYNVLEKEHDFLINTTTPRYHYLDPEDLLGKSVEWLEKNYSNQFVKVRCKTFEDKEIISTKFKLAKGLVEFKAEIVSKRTVNIVNLDESEELQTINEDFSDSAKSLIYSNKGEILNGVKITDDIINETSIIIDRYYQ